MRIKSITLENIRSYGNKKINFPEGSTLLSGNIGSGKTSLLLAIDFVLFGLRKGNLSGNGLLRKGKDEGFVELNFEINEKDIIIRRNLKKSKDKINQISGFFSVNSKKEELSPVELKQRVLELFNYPTESLTKSKSLIFNYTIYTPQEEMKNILLNKPEDRLNILRRVFGIDKYKRVLENSKILISKLKERKKEFNLLSSDLERLTNEKELKSLRIKEIGEGLGNSKEKLIKVRLELDNKRKNVELLEEKTKKRDEIKRDLELFDYKLGNFVNQRSNNKRSVENLISEINELEKELKNNKISDSELFNKKISDTEESIGRIELETREISKKIGEFEFVIRNSNKLKEDITGLNSCPVCKQNVSNDHKHNIEYLENLKLKDANELINEYKSEEIKNFELINELKNKLNELRKEKNKIEVLKLKKENLENKRAYLENLNLEQDKMKKDIGEINSQKIGLNQIIEKLPDVSEIYNVLKLELNEISEIEKRCNSDILVNEREMKLINERILELNLDIKKKFEFKEKIVKYSEKISFIEGEFSSLVSLMEKQFMKKVHSDFDALFKDWFTVLVENEDLEISLSYDFSPKILQNGYDIGYDHLSGGERTAAALAYRLALNQIINTLMSDINTKDLLILDEPTDGFSAEQVDKLRMILDDLAIKQVIIVSHDPKIESFVDNVIRFEKINGVSEIA